MIFNGQKLVKGTVTTDKLFVGRLFDSTDLHIPVKVLHGEKPGPALFVSSTIHGDELNGIEVIHRLAKKIRVSQLRGTLFLVPIVNVFGFNNCSRYLPDRRDLNRCFPGNQNGSLASQVAHRFMVEIVQKCDAGVDLHTGSHHRTNLPQIRINLKHKKSLEYAKRFGAPVILHSDIRDGSLRQAGLENKVPILLFEGGEALRFSRPAMQVALQGVINLMVEMKMIPSGHENFDKSIICKQAYWSRAPHSGVVRKAAKLGQRVRKGQMLALISDPFGDQTTEMIADRDGLIIGLCQIPVVNRGDAVFHIASQKAGGKGPEMSSEIWMDTLIDELGNFG